MARPSGTLGVIPVRYESTRLPGKALREICGKPMIWWVYHRARRSDLLQELVVATDSDLIESYCRENEIPVILTEKHLSGSDRVYEVVQRTDAGIYVNIQGDEPTLRPSHLDALLSAFDSDAVRVATLKVRLDPAEADDPNVVKVVTSAGRRALYFSRSPLPFPRDPEAAFYYKHIGVYAYRRQALEDFHSWAQGELEKAERLEQLRFLENGVPICVVETPHDTIGVDTEEDLRRASQFLSSS